MMLEVDEKLPGIDVILPFHEVNSLLFQALNSVIKSIDVRVRLILIDDRFIKDKAITLETEFPVEFKNFILLRNTRHGYANALNLGLMHATAQYLGFMNSDDLIARDRLKLQIRALQSSSSDLCVGEVRKFSKKGTLPAMAGSINVSRYDALFLLLGAYGADASIVMKREIANEIVFDQNVRSSDWVTALDYYHRFKVCGESSAKYYYRIHSQQTSSQSAYRSQNFREVFPFWSTFNVEMGLPPLNFECAQVIGAPHELATTTEIDFNQINTWKIKYLEKFKDDEAKRMAENLIKRRIVISKIKRRKLTLHIMTTMQLCVEYLITRSRGSNPRSF